MPRQPLNVPRQSSFIELVSTEFMFCKLKTEHRVLYLNGGSKFVPSIHTATPMVQNKKKEKKKSYNTFRLQLKYTHSAIFSVRIFFLQCSIYKKQGFYKIVNGVVVKISLARVIILCRNKFGMNYFRSSKNQFNFF